MKGLNALVGLFICHFAGAQPSEGLFCLKAWPDTLLPYTLEKELDFVVDSTSDLEFHIGEERWVGNSGEALYIVDLKNEFPSLCIARMQHFAPMARVELDTAYWKDINGDGQRDLALRYHFEYLEFHYDDGFAQRSSYLHFIDTVSWQSLFCLEESFSNSSRMVEYVGENELGRANLEEYIIESETQSSMEVSYALRFKNEELEIVCTGMKYQDPDLPSNPFPNRGITRYRWLGGFWVKL